VTSQLEPLYTNGNITLSVSNTKATQSVGNNWTWSYGTPCFMSGKWYWECTCNNQSNTNAPLIGVGPRIPKSTFSPSGNTYPGGSSNSGVGYSQSGSVYYLGATIATGYPTYTTGSVISFAIDYANKNIWVRVNGGNWNGNVSADPATNTGGLSIATFLRDYGGGISPGFGLYYTNDAMTMNFGDSAFAYTVPSGFTAVTSAGVYSGLYSAELNGVVADHAASFTQYGAGKSVTPSSVNKVSSTQAKRGSNIVNAWYGSSSLFSGPNQTISGTVKESGVPVAGKTIYLYDNRNGKLIGSATSDGSGNFSMPSKGVPACFATALDPTTFQAMTYDRLTPV